MNGSPKQCKGSARYAIRCMASTNDPSGFCKRHRHQANRFTPKGLRIREIRTRYKQLCAEQRALLIEMEELAGKEAAFALCESFM